jgi:hypothetical protein
LASGDAGAAVEGGDSSNDEAAIMIPAVSESSVKQLQLQQQPSVHCPGGSGLLLGQAAAPATAHGAAPPGDDSRRRQHSIPGMEFVAG